MTQLFNGYSPQKLLNKNSDEFTIKTDIFFKKSVGVGLTEYYVSYKLLEKEQKEDEIGGTSFINMTRTYQTNEKSIDSLVNNEVNMYASHHGFIAEKIDEVESIYSLITEMKKTG